MGLPGSGKTTLAKLLVPMFNAVWLNADKVREEANDWDFSEMGRSIQANRMKRLLMKRYKIIEMLLLTLFVQQNIQEKILMLTI